MPRIVLSVDWFRENEIVTSVKFWKMHQKVAIQINDCSSECAIKGMFNGDNVHSQCTNHKCECCFNSAPLVVQYLSIDSHQNSQDSFQRTNNGELRWSYLEGFILYMWVNAERLISFTGAHCLDALE